MQHTYNHGAIPPIPSQQVRVTLVRMNERVFLKCSALRVCSKLLTIGCRARIALYRPTPSIQVDDGVTVLNDAPQPIVAVAPFGTTLAQLPNVAGYACPLGAQYIQTRTTNCGSGQLPPISSTCGPLIYWAMMSFSSVPTCGKQISLTVNSISGDQTFQEGLVLPATVSFTGPVWCICICIFLCFCVLFW